MNIKNHTNEILEDISKVIENPRNPNKHSDNQINLLSKIIEFQGWRIPIVVSNRSGFIVRGHGRLMSARKLGLEKVPVSFQDYESEAQEYADLVADNRIAELAEMDRKELKDIIDQLDTGEIDMEMTGFDQESLDDLMSEFFEPEEGETDDDQVPDDVESRCQSGDLWKLGNHKIICGDSTKEETLIELMSEEKADICFTSPPYNAGSLNQSMYKGKRKQREGTKAKYNLFDDNQSSEEYLEFLRKNLQLMIKYSTEVFYNLGLVQNNKITIFKLIDLFNQEFKDLIYWKKNSVAPHIIPGIINNMVEMIICFGNGKRKFLNAQFNQGTYFNVIEGSSAGQNEFASVHKATFPVYLPENIISNFSKKDDIVIDCFLGTGTSLIACEKLSRKCYGIELDPTYCDIVIQRWEDFTGKKAEKISE